MLLSYFRFERPDKFTAKVGRQSHQVKLLDMQITKALSLSWLIITQNKDIYKLALDLLPLNLSIHVVCNNLIAIIPFI